MRACECVDAVVVGAVGERAELVEKVVCVAAADDFEEPVFGGCCDGSGADVFGAGRADARDGVAAKDVLFVAICEGAAGGARFFLDHDADGPAVLGGGVGDELLDGAGRFADADDVGDVVGAGLFVEVET